MRKISFLDRFLKITVRCKSCKGKIRFPLNKGTLRITCPHCHNQFVYSLQLATVIPYLQQQLSVLFRQSGRASQQWSGHAAPGRRNPYVKHIMVTLLVVAVLVSIALNVFNRPTSSAPTHTPAQKNEAYL